MKAKQTKVTFYEVYRTLDDLAYLKNPVQKVKAFFHEDKVIIKTEQGKRIEYPRTALRSTNIKGVRKHIQGVTTCYLREYKYVMWTPKTK